MYPHCTVRNGGTCGTPRRCLNSRCGARRRRCGGAAPDKRWAFNDTACARLNDSGGKVSVVFWLESLESALCGKLGINDTKIQGQHLRLLLEGPILESESLINSSAELRNSLTC